LLPPIYTIHFISILAINTSPYTAVRITTRYTTDQDMTVRDKTPEEMAAITVRGEAVAKSLIGLIFFCWIFYGIN
jgi:hypothetical protein